MFPRSTPAHNLNSAFEFLFPYPSCLWNMGDMSGMMGSVFELRSWKQARISWGLAGCSKAQTILPRTKFPPLFINQRCCGGNPGLVSTAGNHGYFAPSRCFCHYLLHSKRSEDLFLDFLSVSHSLRCLRVSNLFCRHTTPSPSSSSRSCSPKTQSL